MAGATGPVFLVGAPRSGTTLLYKLLCLHPDVAYISNWVRLAPWAPEVAVANRLAARLPRAQLAVWFGGGERAYVYGGHRPLWHRAFPTPVEGEPVFAHAGVSDVPPLDHAAGPALQGSFRRLHRAGGGAVVVNKRIANNRRVAFLAATFPAARFVELVRDGRAVAASLARVDWWPDSRLWWLDGTSPRQAEAAGADPWELCARAWAEEASVTSAAMAELPEDTRMSTTYEAFVGDPSSVLAEVAALAGIDPDNPAWRRRVAGVRFPDRNQAWRGQLDAAAVATVERVQGGTLNRYGYG